MELVSRAHVYVVIPAYNEGTVLSRVVTQVKRAGYAVVVVDDGSTDSTADHARAAGATVVSHPFNLGQGAALQTGIDYALTQDAQFVVTFDADGQHRLADISRLTEALLRERRRFRTRQPVSRAGSQSSAAAPPAVAGGHRSLHG